MHLTVNHFGLFAECIDRYDRASTSTEVLIALRQTALALDAIFGEIDGTLPSNMQPVPFIELVRTLIPNVISAALQLATGVGCALDALDADIKYLRSQCGTSSATGEEA